METPSNPLRFISPEEWRAWLAANGASEGEAWLLIAKKGAARKTITLVEAVEEALCYGWIDSVLKPIDDQAYALRFSPRKPGSIWAESNKKRAEQLIRDGRMRPAGMAQVVAAKTSGEWEAASRREDFSRLPTVLEQALHEDEAIWMAYQKLAPSQKKQYLYWINSAKRSITRQKRVREMIEKLKG